MGELTPIMVAEAIPGDKFQIGCDSLIRFAPLIAPVMHRMDVTMHYFFVPNRLVWSNWEAFITGDGTPDPPTVGMNGTLTADELRFVDYMGVAPFGSTSGGNATAINAIPFAAYQMIYNEYYRDQNLITAVNDTLVDGNNSGLNLLDLRLRSWEHDYFTSSLPFAQKGSPVDIPLGEVVLKGTWATDGDQPFWTDGTINPTGAVTGAAGPQIDVGATTLNAYDPDGSLITSPTTINDLRRAFRLQEWLEKNARGGTRYIENILTHFGVRSSDKRLQRPEYITGVKSPIIVSEVLNSTGETGGLPQGNMAGHAVSVGQGTVGSYRVEEHGFIIGIMSVMPKTAYMQGIPKQYLKLDNLDYYWPSFAHIGEQEVQNQELYAYTSTKADTFGYLPRYAEYRFIPSRVAGDFRNSLDYWHLARNFGAQPSLSQAFIECDPTDVERIFAVQAGDDNLYCHILNKVKAIRPIPVYGTPML